MTDRYRVLTRYSEKKDSNYMYQYNGDEEFTSIEWALDWVRRQGASQMHYLIVKDIATSVPSGRQTTYL